jgi:hypothetical protein
MRSARSLSIGALAVAAIGLLPAAVAAPRITDLEPVEPRDGINTVSGFMPDGSAATIVQAWRPNGNAHGHHDWLVLRARGDGHKAAEVTRINPKTNELDDVIGDAPFDGERVLGSIRFAHGRIDGRPATLLIESRLEEPADRPLADHATATVRVFRLEATGAGPVTRHSSSVRTGVPRAQSHTVTPISR